MSEQVNQEKDIFEMLEKIFSNINYWLAFAEAKNATNLAFVVAIVAIINDINASKYEKNICVFMVGVSGLFSLVSLVPMVRSKICRSIKKIKKILRRSSETNTKNLLFYEDIQYMTGKEYLKKVYKEYFKKDIANNVNKCELDIADEIVINASIASDKYLLFTCAIILDVAAVILLIVAIMLYAWH